MSLPIRSSELDQIDLSPLAQVSVQDDILTRLTVDLGAIINRLQVLIDKPVDVGNVDIDTSTLATQTTLANLLSVIQSGITTDTGLDISQLATIENQVQLLNALQAAVDTLNSTLTFRQATGEVFNVDTSLDLSPIASKSKQDDIITAVQSIDLDTTGLSTTEGQNSIRAAVENIDLSELESILTSLRNSVTTLQDTQDSILSRLNGQLNVSDSTVSLTGELTVDDSTPLQVIPKDVGTARASHLRITKWFTLDYRGQSNATLEQIPKPPIGQRIVIEYLWLTFATGAGANLWISSGNESVRINTNNAHRTVMMQNIYCPDNGEVNIRYSSEDLLSGYITYYIENSTTGLPA